MGRYQPDLAKVQIGYLQLVKDDVEFAVGDVKGFSRKSKRKIDGVEQEIDVYGITYTLTLVKAEAAENTPNIGRTLQHSLYFHTAETESINFSFAMSCLGFGVNEVDAFKEKYGDADFTFDSDNPSEIGQFWRDLVGTRVAATSDLKPRKDDATKMNQQFSWRPV